MIELLFLPILAAMALVFIHVYFGNIILKRGILFIDLAMAQWAALGMVVAHSMGVHHHLPLFSISLAFTSIAAFTLTLLRPYYNTVHLQEALIAVLYIAASAMALALISGTGMEGHHIEHMLNGHLLFIQKSELLSTLAIYAIIAFILYTKQKKLQSPPSKKWEFLFYLLFGAVLTSSVKMAGILLVFSYLVIPSLSVISLTSNTKTQLILAWTIGSIASLLGTALAIITDIPLNIGIILALCLSWLCCTIYSIRKTKTHAH